jgi:hypothetical protein
MVLRVMSERELGRLEVVRDLAEAPFPRGCDIRAAGTQVQEMASQRSTGKSVGTPTRRRLESSAGVSGPRSGDG